MVLDLNRRQFLKVLGVTGAAATVEGCSRGGHQHVMPYLIPKENLLPGVNVDFATVCRECPAGCGMIARVRDGRVLKVDGNPDHPVNRGALCLRGQAAPQGLYNPDRFPGPMARDEHGRLQAITLQRNEGDDDTAHGARLWEDASRRLQKALASARGRRVVWIGGLETGAMDELIGRFLAAVAPGAARLTFETFAYEPLRTAAARVLGAPVVPQFRIAEARTLISFGADFLETWVSNVEYQRDFAAWRTARREGRDARRFVFFGPRLSLTAANADEWVPIRPGTEGLAARAMAAAVSGGDFTALAEQAGVNPDVFRRLAEEFRRGASLALPVGEGSHTEDATAANEAILRMNQAAGNVGRTVIPGEPHALSAVSSNAEVMDALQDMAANPPALVFIHHANPFYSLPPEVVENAFKNVGEVVSFSSFPDETTAHASLVLPDHTFLESWGEYSPRPGITGVMQPVVDPVFNTRQTGDVLIAAAARMGRDMGARDFRTWLRRRHPGEDDAWNATLQRGLVSGAASLPTPVAPRPARTPAPPPPASGGEDQLYLHVYPSLYFYDGRTANRPWAQEIPDPMVKAVWGSWAEIHTETARRLKVSTGDLVTLTTAGGKLQVPAYVSDAVHPQAIAVQMGQGHTASGRYADGAGVNAMALLGAPVSASGARITSGVPVEVATAPQKRPLVIMQTGVKQVQFEIARGVTVAGLAGLAKNGAAAAGEGNGNGQEQDAQHSLYSEADKAEDLTGFKDPDWEEPHWGMAIDLDRCTGCNACVASCYAENNLPVVGREQSGRGREMAWLRIENYVGGLAEGTSGGQDRMITGGLIQIQKRREAGPAPAPGSGVPVDVRFLPMLCQQCDNAPCEYVCPVDATVHSSDHLNQMVYNRCVGTRYCSNNCPYKVRRFNFYQYQWESPLDQQLNPDVTVRSKGVMEKCTFCVQRTRRAKIDARADGRPIREGEVTTACQDACPSHAIVFGNLKDPNSEVARLARDPRGYGALSELNTYPNITYLARVRAE